MIKIKAWADSHVNFQYHARAPLKFFFFVVLNRGSIENGEYDQEIPQSQTADNPVAPRGRATKPPRDTRKTN